MAVIWPSTEYIGNKTIALLKEIAKTVLPLPRYFGATDSKERSRANHVSEAILHGEESESTHLKLRRRRD
jgi:hypothetical protein